MGAFCLSSSQGLANVLLHQLLSPQLHQVHFPFSSYQRLIVKEANPEDKRSQWLQVTDEGNVVMEKIAHVDELILKKMTQDMSSEELEAFQETTSKIVRNLSD
ncbi:hypothetical protein VroAM7_11200 [Vibrio rotiferianus]|uniref:HTH marR-type domain-containing protein n=1 Tax=Vibrio rotiferianus TaxID=190895 RepID=A0A510I4J0_9VIBR|nr:hypothetical protein VroAM7_11200 [Vibrio rotiferianus]